MNICIYANLNLSLNIFSINIRLDDNILLYSFLSIW